MLEGVPGMTTEELILWRIYYDVRNEEAAEARKQWEQEAKKKR